MKDTATYINQEGSANKFWKYTILSNYHVQCEWGRLGLAGQSNEKPFSSRYSAEAFATKKVAEKAKKGYVEKTKTELKDEERTAQEIGTRNKISRMQWVRKKAGKKLQHINSYDPTEWVYVEIMDSWSKDIVARLILNKTESSRLTGVGESGTTITYGYESNGGRGFADAIRRKLRKLAQTIQEVITIHLADMGVRNLGLSDEPVNFTESDYFAITEAVGDSSASNEVICTLAAMGVRKLDL